MPRLWNETIGAHKRAVDEAILDAAAALVQAGGPTSVTMSGVAEAAGIGRATLYKYYPNAEAVLAAWHEHLVGKHLAHLLEIRDGPGDASIRLQAVLEAFALSAHAHGGSELAALLHQGPHVAHAYQGLTKLVEDLLAEGATAGQLRGDVPPAELALYCLHALGAAGQLPSEEAVRALAAVVLCGLRPLR